MKDQEVANELFSVGVYKKSLAYALQAHKEQKTPEGLPYSFHIVSVATEVLNSLSQSKISYDEANIAISCALLHDVNEDTDTRVSNDLNIPNINAVISGVEALTKNETLATKQEQMQDSLERLLLEPKCVQMVKLADRITNLAPAPDFWNRSKRETYVNEAKQILEALKNSNKYLSSKLQSKIDNYVVDANDNFIVFYANDGVIVLDKSHSKYLKTFKAINRLNSYVIKNYDLKLFDRYNNVKNKDEVKDYKKLDTDYIMKVLNEKNLLDLNTQIDSGIDKYFSIILDGEECIS